ncbi:ParA-like protein [Olavius algarvensis associated proteobacterium Delta 3]|nr:ParA-like protein [Olavius algarvensis associated proteobacterium Delta 3]
MTTLALYSNKGGVGKTAAAVNLSYLSAQTGAKTLICDLDHQGSATYYYRVKPKLKSGTKGFIKGGKKLIKSIKSTDYENLDLLPADFAHRNLEAAFYKLKHPRERLSKILKPLKNEYDVILLDCPVTISMLAENIFNAVDYTLVPLVPTTLSVHAHRQLLSFCRKMNYDESKIYTFFSMVDGRKALHRDLMELVLNEFNGALQILIPYLSQIERMGIERQPVVAFSPKSAASKSYENLWSKVRETILSPAFH